MRKTAYFLALTIPLLSSLAALAQPGQPFPAFQKGSVRGDFVWIGNTLAQECDARATTPLVPSDFDPGSCGANVTDTAADVFWTSPLDPNSPGVPYANSGVLASDARSIAVLNLPSGVGADQILYARLYWAAELATDNPDQEVSLDRPGGDVFPIRAQKSYSTPKDNRADGGGISRIYWYESSAGVTSEVKSMLSGPYRVGGVDSIELSGFQSDDTFAAWSLIVFYTRDTDPYRNLSLFEGLNFVRQGNPASVEITDFKVPYAGYDAKLGVMAFEGDTYWTGDSLYFNGNQLSTGEDTNPADDFFNGSRTLLGAPVSTPGDLPQLDGKPNSMSGFDLDVLDVTYYVAPGDTQARFRATSTGDTYVLGAMAASIGTFQPDFTDSVKSFTNITHPDAKAAVAGDVIEYSILVRNTGNDDATGVVLTDVLPAGVTYVGDSLYVMPGGAGADGGVTHPTDGAGDDQGEYDPAPALDGGVGTPTITVRLGEGANATTGGSIPQGGSWTVTFQVTINASPTGPLYNQAFITAGGLMGKEPTPFPTGDGDTPGTPTETPIAECSSNTDCPESKPVCNTSTQQCVECLVDADCGGSTSGRVCTPGLLCANGCRGIGGNGCPSGRVCSSSTTAIGICYTPPSGGGGAGGTGGDAGIGGADGATDAGRDVPMGGGGAGGAGGTGGRRDAGPYDGGGGVDGGPGIDGRGVDGRIADGGGTGGVDGAVVAIDVPRPVDAAGRDLPGIIDAAGRDVVAEADGPAVIPGADAPVIAGPDAPVVVGVGWSVQGGGCSCSTGARPSSGPAALWLAGLAIGLGVVLRRRRR